jgi:predicted ATPase
VLQIDDEMALLEQLGSLIDKSILRRVDDPDEVRVDMLETLREFALERLRARGELDEYRERHAMACAEWAESAVALTRTAERATVDLAMRLVSASWRFWQMCGHIFEGRDRAETSCSSRTA